MILSVVVAVGCAGAGYLVWRVLSKRMEDMLLPSVVGVAVTAALTFWGFVAGFIPWQTILMCAVIVWIATRPMYAGK